METLLAKLKTVQGLDSGPLCPHIQPYVAHVHEQGYKLKTIRGHLRLMADFNRWLVRTGRGLPDLNESTIEAFLRRFFGRRTWRAGERPALHRMLCILRETRATPQAKAIQLTPAQTLAAQYRQYLTEERGCSDWTVGNYSRHIHRFLAQRFGTGPVRFERFRAQDVIAFVQREAGRHGRGHILQVVTGLRSFLRFLRYRGDITTDLAAAVPSVANWQKNDLPKHLPADAVQTVLDGANNFGAGISPNFWGQPSGPTSISMSSSTSSAATSLAGWSLIGKPPNWPSSLSRKPFVNTKSPPASSTSTPTAAGS